MEMIATRDAYGKALVELGLLMDKVVVLDADLSKSTKTVLFAENYPLRFFNMGIAEADMMGTAAGLAASGYIPLPAYLVFLQLAGFMNSTQLYCLYQLNVKIAATHAGITVGEDGASHQTLAIWL